MSTTVSGSNSLSFAIIRDQSLEVWQRLANDWRYRHSQIFQALLPFFFIFACFLIFLKKAFSERKIALEIFPKKDEGTLQITVQSMTNATFETVDQVRKASPVWPPTKKNAFTFTFLPFFSFFKLFWLRRFLIIAWKKYQRVTSLFSKTYPEPEPFLSTLLGPPTCFLFVCELVSIRLSDSKWGNSPPAKVKPVED